MCGTGEIRLATLYCFSCQEEGDQKDLSFWHRHVDPKPSSDYHWFLLYRWPIGSFRACIGVILGRIWSSLRLYVALCNCGFARLQRGSGLALHRQLQRSIQRCTLKNVVQRSIRLFLHKFYHHRTAYTRIYRQCRRFDWYRGHSSRGMSQIGRNWFFWNFRMFTERKKHHNQQKGHLIHPNLEYFLERILTTIQFGGHKVSDNYLLRGKSNLSSKRTFFSLTMDDSFRCS